MANKTVLTDSKMFSQNTRDTIKAAERKALQSLLKKEQSSEISQNQLNLLDEFRKYRRSDETKPLTPRPLNPKRKAKSI